MSCTKNKKLDYKRFRTLYDKSITCIQQKQKNIFLNQDSSLQGISIYKNDLARLGLCGDLDSLFKVEPIALINIEQDGTIYFYSEVSGNIKSKQFILMFLEEENRLQNKITTEMKVTRIDKNNWFEIEKVISLAN